MKKKDKKIEEVETVNEDVLEDTTNDEIELLGNRIKDLENALLRNQAELQNYKRRRDEEMSRLLKYEGIDVIKELLPIVDNFERAINMDDDNLEDEVSKFLEGFKLIYNNVKNLLNKFEVTEISEVDVEFDPNIHNAVLTDHNEEKETGVILEVMQKGYIYKDKVIRPAMVKVNE